MSAAQLISCGIRHESLVVFLGGELPGNVDRAPTQVPHPCIDRLEEYEVDSTSFRLIDQCNYQ